MSHQDLSKKFLKMEKENNQVRNRRDGSILHGCVIFSFPLKAKGYTIFINHTFKTN